MVSTNKYDKLNIDVGKTEFGMEVFFSSKDMHGHSLNTTHFMADFYKKCFPVDDLPIEGGDGFLGTHRIHELERRGVGQVITTDHNEAT